MKGLPYSNRHAVGAVAPVVKKVTIPVNNLSLTVSAGVAAVGFGTAVIAGLPEGNILLLGALAYMRFSTSDTDIIAAFDGDFSIGTVATADNDVADSNEANIIASTALGAATARVSPTLRATNTTSAVIDNTDASLKLNLNLLIDDASITDSQSAAFLCNGSVHLVYAVLGDD
jgi:hypothetical protein